MFRSPSSRSTILTGRFGFLSTRRRRTAGSCRHSRGQLSISRCRSAVALLAVFTVARLLPSLHIVSGLYDGACSVTAPPVRSASWTYVVDGLAFPCIAAHGVKPVRAYDEKIGLRSDAPGSNQATAKKESFHSLSPDKQRYLLPGLTHTTNSEKRDIHKYALLGLFSPGITHTPCGARLTGTAFAALVIETATASRHS